GAVVHSLLSGSDVELARLHTSNERLPLAVGVADGRLIGPLAVANFHATLDAASLDTVRVAAEARLPPISVQALYGHSAISSCSMMSAMSPKLSVGLIASSRSVSTALLYRATDLASVIVADEA